MVLNDEVVSAQVHSYRLLTTGSLRQAGMLRGRIFMDRVPLHMVYSTTTRITSHRTDKQKLAEV